MLLDKFYGISTCVIGDHSVCSGEEGTLPLLARTREGVPTPWRSFQRRSPWLIVGFADPSASLYHRNKTEHFPADRILDAARWN
jgi:hypothetical protein